jgi:histone-lysine N-methyltransferase SETMAR
MLQSFNQIGWVVVCVKKKISARWMSRLLTVDNKRNRAVASKARLSLMQRNPDKFFCRFVTVDETWIHHYTPETKEQSKQWIAKGESCPKKAKIVKSTIATVFWDARGIIFVDYLEKGKTITGDYYASLLDQLKNQIEEKRPHLNRKKSSVIRTMPVFTHVYDQWLKLKN